MATVSGRDDSSKRSTVSKESALSPSKTRELGGLRRGMVHLDPTADLPDKAPVKVLADKVADLVEESIDSEGALAANASSSCQITSIHSLSALRDSPLAPGLISDHLTSDHLVLGLVSDHPVSPHRASGHEEIKSPTPTTTTRLAWPPHSPTIMEIDRLRKSYALHSTIKQLVKEFVSKGLLSQALWVIQREKMEIDSLRDDLPAEVIDWIELKLSFTSDATTPLDTMALNRGIETRGLGWGYKAANLTRLAAHCKEVSALCSTCSVKVPPFFPLGDFEMQGYLREGFPELEGSWHRFLASFTDERLDSFIATNSPLNISAEGHAILKKIQDGIQRQFIDSTFTTPQLEEWLRTQAPKALIVRSSGKEDSDTNSNAGGNASMAFVKPEAKAISRAIGEVLASYFSEKSLLQRLAAHDLSIFEEDPFMPVLIQEMVSENVGGIGTLDEEVPRSGVMFTRSSGKAEGLTELYVGLGNNEGIVASLVATDHYQLDAFEGLAKSIEPKETRIVAQRCEDGTHACGEIANESELLRLAPSLPDAIAHDFKKVADYFSCEYGSKESPKALDIEFTTLLSSKDSKPTIYLLQARPLIEVKRAHEPSYLPQSVLEALPSHHQIKGDTLLDGGAYVRSIETGRELLVCTTIIEALDRYLHSPHRAEITTVIIQQPAPGTSHGAVEMRRYGLGVLVVPAEDSFKELQEWHRSLGSRAPSTSSSENSKRLVDFQRGVVVKIAKTTELSATQAMGYTCYPMPLAYSMTPSSMVLGFYQSLKLKKEGLDSTALDLVNKTAFNAFRTRFNSLLERCSPEGHAERFFSVNKREEVKGATLRQLLEFMASDNEEEAKKAGASLLNTLRKVAFDNKLKASPQAYLEMMLILETVVDIVEKQYLPALEASAAYSLERLYPIRLLEAALFQPRDEVRGGFSLQGTLKAIKDEKELLKLLPAATTETNLSSVFEREERLLKAPLAKLSAQILKPELSAIWQTVLSNINEANPEEVKLVCQWIIEMEKVDSLTDWANSDLITQLEAVDLANRSTSPSEPSEGRALFLTRRAFAGGSGAAPSSPADQSRLLFSELAKIALRSQSDLLHCQQVIAQVKTLRSHLDAWADPSHVKKQAASLAKSYEKLGFASFEDDYKACSTSMKMAYLNTMLDAIRLYDEIIKTNKASAAYSENPQEHAADLQLLLQGYHSMMKAVLKATDPFKDTVFVGFTLQKYLKIIDKGSKYTFEYDDAPYTTPGFGKIDLKDKTAAECNSLLLASPEFNVAAAAIGNSSDYEYGLIWPTTLEDYFTLFHQNMEAAIASLKLAAGFSITCLPTEFSNHCHSLMTEIGEFKGRISSIELDGPLIQVAIDLPLRQHAAKLLVKYDRSKTPTEISHRMEIFGAPEYQRWELTAGAAGLVGSDIPGLRVSKPEINWAKPSGIAFEVRTVGATVEQNRAFFTFLRNIHTLSKTMNSFEDQKGYFNQVVALRKSFAPTSSPITDSDADLLGGGFYLAATAIEELQKEGKTAEAEALYLKMRDLLALPEHAPHEHADYEREWIAKLELPVLYHDDPALTIAKKLERLSESFKRS